MHKYIILFFLVLTILCSCNSDNAPDGVLKKAAMINVLTEVHIVDGTLISISQAPDSLYKYGYQKYSAVFKKYGTDSAEFKRSFKYYSLKPAALTDMYTEVLKKIQVKSDSLTKLLTVQNKKNHVISIATGGRIGAPAGPALATPVRPGIVLNPNQPEIIKFNSKRDSAIRKQLKERNALPKK